MTVKEIVLLITNVNGPGLPAVLLFSEKAYRETIKSNKRNNTDLVKVRQLLM